MGTLSLIKTMQTDKKTRIQLDKEVKQEIDISNYVLDENVRIKTANLHGFELDYNSVPEREPDFSVTVPLYAKFQPKPDIDYEISEMTPEQREVFDALEFEGDDDAYEELEDDFVVMANDGEVPLKLKNPTEVTAVADDIQKALIKEKKKKFNGVMFDMDSEKKTSAKKREQKRLLDQVDKWDNDDMEKFGYTIEAKGGNGGLELDGEEFPTLDGDNYYESLEAEELATGQNMKEAKKLPESTKFYDLEPILEENILDRLELNVPARVAVLDIDISESKNVDLVGDQDIDLVQVIPSEENVTKLLEAEYSETPKETQPGLSKAAFNRILDNHITEMDNRQKLNPVMEKETYCSGNLGKKAKKNQRKVSDVSADSENQLDAMMQQMGGDSDEDLDCVDLNNAPMVERKGKAGVMFMDDIEEVKKFRNGKEYESQSFTSSAGGKLIINTIKKGRAKKGKPSVATKVEKLPDNITERSEVSRTTKSSKKSKIKVLGAAGLNFESPSGEVLNVDDLGGEGDISVEEIEESDGSMDQISEQDEDESSDES